MLISAGAQYYELSKQVTGGGCGQTWNSFGRGEGCRSFASGSGDLFTCPAL